MLHTTTLRHQVMIIIPAAQFEDKEMVDSARNAVDDAIDELVAVVKQDAAFVERLRNQPSRQHAFDLIQEKAISTQVYKLCYKLANPSLYRRVLYLVAPDRYGFERYGWIY